VPFMLALVRECNMLTAMAMSVVRWFTDDLHVAARIEVRGSLFDWPICAARMRTRRVFGRDIAVHRLSQSRATTGQSDVSAAAIMADRRRRCQHSDSLLGISRLARH